MEAFIVAAECGNFSEAARRLDISAVMVGKHIRQLEKALGMRLIERNTRRQHLTTAGQTFYHSSREALSQLRWAESQVESLRRFPSGTLRISAPENLGSSVLAPILARYQQAWPAVRIELVLDDRFVDLIDEGFDFALRIGALADDLALVALALGEYQMVVCASPDYLAHAGIPASPQDLNAHRCLGNMHWNKRNAWLLGDTFWPLQTTFSCNDGQSLRQAALAGAGLLLQPRVLVADDLACGRLLPLLSDWLPQARPVHLLFHPGQQTSATHSSVVEWLRREIPLVLAR
ncbi:LysR family transcriptional regulator [Erwinia sp. OLTSP20]|nr:LysR family transcriptional regulator [Erwinia sp. OAMSP11]PIJ75440.1 LysR family transcriptional regulator [Erwinia sp. OLSSP12]PIJ81990.1 LysR family transcriptional regulator [Erwinia sp. OLCASP19]PIJ84645.1 LysR family transcriptional regulator [Erwinia sp. OLMTSP26]PIJ86994.1 LysR family transcriptional regulator [Erwinia sp. OLMDSP33]PIJ91087.1 LysR family transcriptional regulator [Erwinia sp. OLFS4]PIJ92576.1 LysR family transcriptional regulator [Erwinia sp. OLTSP20]